MKERRKYIRFEVPLKLEFIVSVPEKCVPKGIIKDFSREGAGLVLYDCNAEQGDDVQLKLYVPRRRNPVPVSGEIVWREYNGTVWEVGILIKDIDRVVKSEILDYAYKLWRWGDNAV